MSENAWIIRKVGGRTTFLCLCILVIALVLAIRTPGEHLEGAGWFLVFLGVALGAPKASNGFEAIGEAKKARTSGGTAA